MNTNANLNNAKPPQNSANIKKYLTVPACLMVQLSVGILYLWSIFNKDVQTQLSLSANLANLVASFMMLGFVLGNLAGGFLQDKTNPRLVSAIGCAIFSTGIICTSLLKANTIGLIFLTYSAMGGIGCGFVYGSILSCLQKWFPTRRGFASGLSVAAFGLSTVVFAPLSQMLLGKYSVSVTFRILGFTFLAVSAISCVFISLPKGESAKAALTGLTPKQAVKKLSFWCIALTLFFANATWNILIPIIKPLGISRGLGENTAGYVVMVAGIANVLGRFGMASLSDKIRREFAVIAMSALTLCCAAALIWAQGALFFVVIAATAFAYGAPSAILPAMTVDICGAKYSGTNYGIAMLGLGVSSIVFTSLSDLLKNTTGDYTLSFVMAGCTCIVSAGLMLLYGRLNKGGGQNFQNRRSGLVAGADTTQKAENNCVKP